MGTRATEAGMMAEERGGDGRCGAVVEPLTKKFDENPSERISHEKETGFFFRLSMGANIQPTCFVVFYTAGHFDSFHGPELQV
jgi:hypothetical protein